jgi:MFS transporter, DHA1 family, inner membrane transport protein
MGSQAKEVSPGGVRATGAPPPPGHWIPFALVCVAYLAVTVGEQVLSPVFPTAADDLGLTVSQGGLAFGVLTASIAASNLIGGFLLRRWSAAALIRSAAAVAAIGAVVAATANGFGQLLGAQVLLGAGAGLFFPAGLQAVSLTAGARKGFAMGIYGVAFSGGLALAALLGAVGAGAGWRTAFWVSAGLSVTAVVATLALRVRAPHPEGGHAGIPWRRIFGLPTAVGSVGAVCQYGAIPFLTTYAVVEWDLSKARAATLLAVGRVISIVAKLVSGARADRVGARASARSTGIVLVLTGLGWVLLPAGLPAYAMAVVFAGWVSSLFPVANVLAVERFGQNGAALGAYRSAQIGIGAAAGAVIGLVGDQVGLRPTLLVAVVTPALLLWICREPRPHH